MKFVISFLLLCIIFENCVSDKIIRDKLAKSMITMKHLLESRKRKLQKTDEEPEITVPTYPSASELPSDAAETVSEPVIVDPSNSTTVSPKDTKKPEDEEKKTSSTLTVKKFHSFDRPNKKVITFNILFYFFNKPIVKTIVLRLTIMYKKGRLRNLQTDIPGESVATPCVIKDESKIGMISTGENIDYDCTAPTQSENDIDSATVDASKPMVVGNESVKFDDVKFEPEAIEGAENLSDKTKVKTLRIINLDKTVLENMEAEKFELSCTYGDENKLRSSETFNMKFYDYSKGELSNSITCKSIGSGDTCQIECDTTQNPLSFYVRNLTNSEYQEASNDNKYVIINTDDSKDDGKLHNSITSSNSIYRKNSSGLSGGAIAGIVIACVVVLAAASIAAIMLRKPSPPIDNTTVVGLKTVENI